MAEWMLDNTFECPRGFVQDYNDCKHQRHEECIECERWKRILAEKVYLNYLLNEYGVDCLWISVKDRLPEAKVNWITEDWQRVLCCCDFGGDPRRVDVRAYQFADEHFWHGPLIMDSVVTHWMPLPEPPKE